MNSFDFDKVHFNTGLLVKECFKRGINVIYLWAPDILLASYQGHKEIITETTLSCMPYPLKYVMDDKSLEKFFLQKIKISTTQGKSFKTSELWKALVYAKKIGFPVVIKPTLGSHWASVHMNLRDFDEIATAWESISWELGNYIDGDILVEKQFDGKEFRIFITKNDFIAIVEREPANVIGDGKTTIKKLIESENYRRMHPRNSCLCEIYLDDIAEKFLKDTRVKLSDIPAKGEKVYIRPNSNVSGGGNCHDVTDSVHPSVISIAREILQKLTLPYVGIDFMTKDITKKQTKNSYSICELNTMPGLSLHTHEETGRVRNVAGALVDLIYPETKEK